MPPMLLRCRAARVYGPGREERARNNEVKCRDAGEGDLGVRAARHSQGSRGSKPIVGGRRGKGALNALNQTKKKQPQQKHSSKMASASKGEHQ